MKILKENLDFEYEILAGNEEVEISGLSYDTRKVEKGDIFVCLKGSNFNSHLYIDEIIKKGAAAVVIEEDVKVGENENITLIKTDNAREALASLSAAFFSYPAKFMTVIGVTGTKGKTTTTHMIKRLLEVAGYKVGMCGTNGIFIGDEYVPSLNTTPESFELQRYFRKMLDASCTHVVMEVSSQAVKMSRVHGIDFDYGIFTNISPDHIGKDEHKDFEEYLDCKTRFFNKCKLSLLNADDPKHEYIINNSTSLCYFTYGSSKDADFYFSKVKHINNKSFVGLEFSTGGITDVKVKVGMPGNFNIYNALAGISLATFLKLEKAVLEEALADIRVDGRMEIVHNSGDFSIIVDYAHNALSMEKLLSTLREYKPKRLVVVFGCGGNRAKERRYSMGEMAGKMADLSILTADNSRFEKTEDIIADIRSHLEPVRVGECIEIPDRKEAIFCSIKNAKKGDMIAIIGKGHEDYQEKDGIRTEFKDAKVVEELLKNI